MLLKSLRLKCTRLRLTFSTTRKAYEHLSFVSAAGSQSYGSTSSSYCSIVLSLLLGLKPTRNLQNPNILPLGFKAKTHGTVCRGYIGFEAFEEIMIQRYATQDPMDEIRKAFAAWQPWQHQFSLRLNSHVGPCYAETLAQLAVRFWLVASCDFLPRDLPTRIVGQLSKCHARCASSHPL